MRFITNIDRDVFGGITVSNVKLFDWIQKTTSAQVIGIEFFCARMMREPNIFDVYTKTILDYYVVNVFDVLKKHRWGRRPFLSFFWRLLFRKIGKIISDERVDVVLVNGTYWASFLLAYSAFLLDKPFVLRYAGLISIETKNYPWFSRVIFSYYERWMARHATIIVYPSLVCKNIVERDVLKKQLVLSYILPNPQEIPAWRRKKESKYHAPVFGFVGRLASVKNFPAFIRLHALLLEKNFQHRAVAILNAYPKKHHFPDSLEILSSMTHEELQKFYSTLDVLIVPSHFETFGNVVAEALLQGTSVLVTPSVGIASFMEEAGLSRMIIPSFDDEAVVIAALEYIQKHPITKKEWQRLADILSSDHVHEQFLSVLHSACSK